MAEPELSQAASPVTLDAFWSWVLSFVLPLLQAQPFAVPWAGEATALAPDSCCSKRASPAAGARGSILVQCHVREIQAFP